MSGHGERGAGWSAAAKAQEVRAAGRGGRLRRVLARFGLDPRAARVEAQARNWDAGAEGERRTAALLAPLGKEGWHGFHDRALPFGRANFDHVLIPPGAGMVVLVDSKLWSRRTGTVARTSQGTLVHGRKDQQGEVDKLLWEAEVLGKELAKRGQRVEVAPVMVFHSAPVSGGRFTMQGVVVIEAGQLTDLLRGWAGRPDRAAFGRLVAAADAALPRYVQETGGSR